MHKRGNVLDRLSRNDDTVLVNLCSDEDDWSSDFMRELNKKYPLAKREYNKSGHTMGDTQLINTKGLYIANCTVIEHDSGYMNFDAFDKCMSVLSGFARDRDVKVIMSKNSIEIDDDDWADVEEILIKEFRNLPMFVYVSQPHDSEDETPRRRSRGR